MATKTEIYKKTFNENDFPGLDPINKREKEIYGSQEPVHMMNPIPYELGGPDPLWAIDYFKSDQQQKHFHYITLGFTNLFYEEDFAEDEINGFGFELTFRHLPSDEDNENSSWAVNFLQNIARYVFSTQNGFDDYHYMSANGPIRLDSDTNITALIFFTDPEMKELDTPHGHLKFLQVFGITTQEYEDILHEKITPEELIHTHQLTNPLLITDLAR